MFHAIQFQGSTGGAKRPKWAPEKRPKSARNGIGAEASEVSASPVGGGHELRTAISNGPNVRIGLDGSAVR